MRLPRIFGLLLVLSLSAAAAEVKPPALSDCDRLHTAQACDVSPAEFKQARQDFQHGLRFRKSNDLQQAFDAFDSAAKTVPSDFEYLTAREVVRQQLVMKHVETGNSLMEQQQTVRAAAEFREATRLDPNNTFAQQRLHDAEQQAPKPAPDALNAIISDALAPELRLAPKPGRRDIHLRGDVRTVLSAIAGVYGLKASFDESTPSRNLTVDLGGATFQEAMTAASLMSKTFWVPMSPTEFLVSADTPTQHQELDRMVARTFYFQDATSIQELTDILNVFRTIFEVRFGVQQPTQFSIVVRAQQRTLDTLAQFVKTLQNARPQVMLDMKVYEVNASMLRDFGLEMPLQWSLINLTSGALALLGQQNIQDLVNQLIASGGINQAGSTAIAALLQQLQNGQQNPLLKNPFGTFGGGFTRFALPFAPSNFHLSLNESHIESIEHAVLRASQGNAATLRIGSRYPITNAIFAPIFNTSAIAQVIQNQSFQAPFPSFTFEDLGLTLKATPQIHGDEEVTLTIDLAIKNLSSTAFNGVPVIGNREYNGTIRIPSGESGIVTGMITRSEANTLTGLPGIAKIPGLGTALSHQTKDVQRSELLVVITPHIVRANMAESTEMLVPTVR